MKKRLITLFLAAAALAALAGCALHPKAVDAKLDAIEEKVDAKLDAIEEKAEQKTTIPEGPIPFVEAPQNNKAMVPSETDAAPKGPDSQDKLSREEAERIALEHAGLSAAEVARLHTEYDVDDRVPEYEVEFRTGRMEYHYEIHAETGVILKAEKELDD